MLDPPGSLKWSPNRTKIDEKSSPSPSWAVFGSQERPRAPKMRPRCAQEAPKSAQEPPKSSQELPRSRPGGAREDPKPFQNRARGRPRRDFGTFFVRSSIREAPGTIFCRFWLVCNTLNVLKTYEKHRKNCSFCTSGAFAYCKLACTKKPRKIRFWNPKTLPGPSWNLLKSSPERPKRHKNRPRATTKAARRAKCAQEAPKSEKWCQHGAPKTAKIEESRFLGPPPST